MNKSQGFLLLELNIVLLLVLMLVANLYKPFLQMLEFYPKIEGEINLQRNERLVVARLEQELSYHTKKLIISTGEQGNSILEAMLLVAHKKRTYYCRPYTGTNWLGLYQETKAAGKKKGVNPLSPPDIQILSFQAEPVEKDGIILTLVLEEICSGRQHSTRKYIRLLNGVVDAKA